ncbi:dihydroorotase, partial [Lactobacillus sp. XV13L]|nr:dihydroorotase [Lactobacillus sp. XV13L]
MRILLQGAQVFQNNRFQVQDILINQQYIEQIGHHLTAPDARILAMNNRVIAPGFVDVHVHLREPGFNAKENIKTGTLAGAHGGYTTVAAMPNVQPSIDTPRRLQAQIARNQVSAQVHVLQYANITKDRTSEQLVDFAALKAAGAFGFSNDGNGVQSAQTMYQAMLAAKQANLPIMAHIEDD